MTQFPLAHAGHWIADGLYAAPVIAVAVALWLQSQRDKRNDKS